MSNYIYNPNSGELYHYGVKGMKWGHRKKPEYVETARANMKSARADKRAADRAYNKSFNRASNYSSAYFISQHTNKKRRAESDQRWADAHDKANAANKASENYKNAKSAYKQAKQKANKSAVKEYQKLYNEASNMSDIANEKWNAVKEQHRALGRNKVERVLNAARNKTPEAKAYAKAYNEASKYSDLADAKWNEAKASYVNTGRNRIERIMNNARYS